MAWAAPTTLGSGQSVSSTTFADVTGAPANGISLNPGESCVIQLVGTSAGTTSDLQFQVLTSPDGGTTWDTVPFMSGSIGWPGATTTARRSFTVYGCKTFKLQLAVSAAQTWTTCNAVYVKDGISA